MCSISWGFLCLHIRRFLCYTAKNSKIVSCSFAVATYPREGTETAKPGSAEGYGCGCNLSPRGDGNIRRAGLKVDHVSCNLSPRGDGNPATEATALPRRFRCNLSPRGDGNFDAIHIQISPHCVATYPREGTETAPYQQGSAASGRCNLSPRGDGNTT